MEMSRYDNKITLQYLTRLAIGNLLKSALRIQTMGLRKVGTEFSSNRDWERVETSAMKHKSQLNDQIEWGNSIGFYPECHRCMNSVAEVQLME